MLAMLESAHDRRGASRTRPRRPSPLDRRRRHAGSPKRGMGRGHHASVVRRNRVQPAGHLQALLEHGSDRPERRCRRIPRTRRSHCPRQKAARRGPSRRFGELRTRTSTLQSRTRRSMTQCSPAPPHCTSRPPTRRPNYPPASPSYGTRSRPSQTPRTRTRPPKPCGQRCMAWSLLGRSGRLRDGYDSERLDLLTGAVVAALTAGNP